MNNTMTDPSKFTEITKKIIKHAKKWIKKEAYTYVFNFEEDHHYNDFLEFLIEETDRRSSIEYYFIDQMAYTYVSNKNSVLCKLLFFSDKVLQYPCLYKSYFEETINAILNIPEFEIYHGDVKTLYDNFIELDKKRDGDSNLLIDNSLELLAKNTNINIDE